MLNEFMCRKEKRIGTSHEGAARIDDERMVDLLFLILLACVKSNKSNLKGEKMNK